MSMSGPLEIARAHYVGAPRDHSHLPAFGTRWDHFRREMAEAIMSFGSAQEAIAYGQLKCGFDHRGPVTEADIAKMLTAQRLLAYEYPKFATRITEFSETSVTTPDTALEFVGFDGRRVFASNILYFHMFYLLTVLSQLRCAPESICEIGGGYGNPALIWLTNPIHRPQRYAIVDLPESLFFAEVFLRTALPHVRVRLPHRRSGVRAGARSSPRTD